MEKLKMQTPDVTVNHIEQIAGLFPNVITEIRDQSGNLKKAVDFDLLKQVLSESLVEDDSERYRLDWPGKKASLLKANTPIIKTLRPCRDESVSFDATENLYIEGDNFEVLKILQESYLGRIKMIYIDPPYNTGNDFIYKDNFAKSKDEYEEELGTTDEEGGKLFRNTDSNGRYHSDWLSMMYERLVVARDLLKDDGVIFISIDDNEVHNLRKICDEIFGEENFIGDINWIKKTKPINSGNSRYQLQKKIEYIIVYCKNKNQGDVYKFNLKEIGKREYIYQGELGLCRLKDILDSDIGQKKRDTMKFPIFGINPPEGQRWKVGQAEINKLIETNRIEIVDNKVKIAIYPQDEEGVILKPFWSFLDEVGTAENGKKELNDLMEDKIGFDTVKPVNLLIELIEKLGNNDIILDFFSGSATTAHAVMQLNAEDGGNRKFIMVQLPEPCDENSEAFKAGYKTIAEIGKERIRRAGKKIEEELKAKNQQLKIGQEPIDASKLDIGFRVYKTDDTNMKDVFYHPSELDQQDLTDSMSNIKEDRTSEDLLTQVILDLGLELTLPIETKKILKNGVFIIQTNAMVACFDNDIDFKIVDTISDLKPLKVVFKDASFKDDKDRINVEERFKRLSPETKVTVI